MSQSTAASDLFLGRVNREEFSSYFIAAACTSAAILIGWLLGLHLKDSLSSLNFSATQTSQSAITEPTEAPTTAHTVQYVKKDERFATEAFLLVMTAIVVLGFSALRKRKVDQVAKSTEPLDYSARQKSRVFAKRQNMYLAFSEKMSDLFDDKVTVEQIMTSQVITIPPDMKISKARKLMTKNRLHHLLIEKDEKLVGIVSDRDVLSASRCDATVAQIMASDPTSVHPETPLMDALSLLVCHRISCLPVTNSKSQTVGVMATTDVILALQAMLRAASELSGAFHEFIDSSEAKARCSPNQVAL